MEGSEPADGMFPLTSLSDSKNGKLEKFKDPRMLALSEITTPDAPSAYADDDEFENDNGSDNDSEERKKKKPYSSYIVR